MTFNIIKSGVRARGFVDHSACRHWGRAATKDGSGFAKRYDKHGRPCYESQSEVQDAVLKARDHGEDVASVRARDYDPTA